MARGWSTQEKARDEIERLTGWRIPQSVYAEWESGRRTPTEGNLEKLREFYGKEETAPSAMGEGGLEALVVALTAQTTALTAQTKAINALVGVLGGTPSEDADAAIERLVDRYMSRRHAPDPVPSGER